MEQWLPDKQKLARPAFVSLATLIEEAILHGELEPGDRLPPQREMADAMGVSLQTVSRAYDELRRRNYTQGEIGRGTYVRARHSVRKLPFGAESASANIIEMSIFKPVVDAVHEEALQRALLKVAGSVPRDICFSFRPNEGLRRHRDAAVEWLHFCGLRTDARQVMITNGVTQATNVALLSIARAGDTILSENISSHSLMALCSFVGLKLRGVEMDEHGIVPEAFDRECRRTNVAALYLIPSLANPAMYLMPQERREAIAEIARKHRVYIIENDVLGPLVPNKPQPLAAIAPERSFYLTSFTKTIMPGMRTGYLVVPLSLIREVRNRVLATVWMATPLTAEVMTSMIDDGTAKKLVLWQRRALMNRNKLTRRMLAGLSFHGHPYGMHIWLPLPGRWRPAAFVEQAMEQGVAVAPSDPFLVGFNTDVRAVRVSIGSPGIDGLKRGLRVIRQLCLALEEIQYPETNVLLNDFPAPRPPGDTEL